MEMNEAVGAVPAKKVKSPKVLSTNEMLSQLFIIVDDLLKSRLSEKENTSRNIEEVGGSWPELLGPRPYYDGTQELGKFIHIETFIRDLEFCMSSESWTDRQKVE